jgi:formate dehydrogenase (NADP+) beta subunit
VDCQWACPAHTNVPEYIRLIAQGRYTEAYLLNRVSNVFPGILGRTCDRPCEPACRRTRVDGKPVAICRLKRVAADHRGDVDGHSCRARRRPKNGFKRIALRRRRPGVAHRLQRSDAARLRLSRSSRSSTAPAG